MWLIFLCYGHPLPNIPNYQALFEKYTLLVALLLYVGNSRTLIFLRVGNLGTLPMLNNVIVLFLPILKETVRSTNFIKHYG